ncbi:putative pectinesterase A [Paramyrothecium foliicola]|nr:putative pectinesterase A [Paramyrothecium foliicola]
MLISKLSCLVALGAGALPALAQKATIPVTTYSACQKKTADPLEGCPAGTLYVSQNKTGADFTTIQAAIRSLPNDTSPHVILIGAGIYFEQLNVTRPGPLTLLGQSDAPSQAALYADVTYNTEAANEVQVFHNAANHDRLYPDNLHTSVLAVGPTYNATLTGAGPTGYPVAPDTPFGCSDFRAYNIDFRNEYAPRSSGPAHAIAVGYANTGFYSCGFYSYQDTVSSPLLSSRSNRANRFLQIFVGKLGNTIMYDSIIAGQTDFLYGFGTLFVEKSTLLMRSCGGGVTAWKGTNTTFENKYGVYVSDSQLIASNTTVLANSKGKCSLGRPWNSIHRSVIMNTYIDETVLPAGYTVWSGQPSGNFGNGTVMATYETYGPGNNVEAQRASNVTSVLSKDGVKPYFRPRDVFMTPEGEQPNVDWIDPVALKQCSWRS